MGDNEYRVSAMQHTRLVRIVLSAMLLLGCFTTVGCRNRTSAGPKPDSVSADDHLGGTTDELQPEQGTELRSDSDDVKDSEIDRTAAADSSKSSLSQEPESVGPDLDPEEVGAQDEIPEGNWTRRRLIALSPTGPLVIDLAVSLGSQDLEEATRTAAKSLADEICKDLESPVMWSDFLEHPIVKSGWLGNLVAEEDQVEQLISMYDTERDDTVAFEELPSFFSRGLARNAPLRISDIGVQPGSTAGATPWGKSDQNQDHSLDQTEMEQLSDVLSRLDFNGDAIVSRQELTQSQSNAMQDNRMDQTSMLDTNTLIFDDGLQDEDSTVVQRACKRLAKLTLEQYTFLDGVPRTQWQTWSDDRWSELDTNGDARLSRKELEALGQVAADVEFYLRFPPFTVREQQFQLWSRIGKHQAVRQWHETDDGGRLQTGGCIVQVQVEDAFTGQGPELLRQRLAAALKEPQLQAFFTNQLGLQPDSFDLIDPDGDDELSDAEFDRAWNWLSSRQGARLLARWMTAADPWFQLFDSDGDDRLTEVELSRLPMELPRFDSNADQSLTPNELPLLVRMELSRTDNRLNGGPLGNLGQDSEDQVDADWFSAMDTNRDGFVSKSEFLGESDDFDPIDANKDGFLARSEVYEAFGSY